MGKGSQLSQLKSALSQAGFSRQSHPGQKRKRSGPQEPDKDKNASKLYEIHQKLNPFDVKVTKVKHDVGGRKIKGVTGKPGESKQAGIEQRKKTLLKEYEQKGRSGGLLDRRFGENDPTMTPEDRMMERFTRERQRASRGAAFNLEDEEDLTHYGQSLSKLDDFDGAGIHLEDDEDEGTGQIDASTVKKVHFGGFDDEDNEEEDGQPARKKSKAEVMAEVISKSKEHKFQRQVERQKDENTRHELDQEFDSIRSLLFTQPVPSSTGSNAIPLGRSAPAAAEQDHDYDQHVRQLAFDKRAKAKDRTKTEEELALEEKTALEKAERRRLRRMLGEDDDISDEDGNGRAKLKRQRGGDDLDDDFVEDAAEWDELGDGLGTGATPQHKHNVDSEDKTGSQRESSDGEDSEAIISEIGDGESEGEEGEQQALVSPQSKPRKRNSTAKTPSEELPFTFSCPSSHEEFLEIVERVDDRDVPIVVQRIRSLHHASLAEENKGKLQGLITVLIDHILYVASHPLPQFTLISGIIPHVFALTKTYPIQSAQCFVSKLTLMQKNLMRGLSRGATDPDARIWPGPAELAFLRTVSAVWPTSDMNHAVVSPARLLMGAYLGLGRVRSLKDLGSGAFLCSLFLQFEALSKRLVPEAVNFLVNAVLHLAPNSFKDSASLPGSFPSPDFCSEACRSLRMDKNYMSGLRPQTPDIVHILCDKQHSEQVKLDLFGSVLDMLGRFADMYKGLSGFIELYQPILDVLRGVESNKLSEALHTRILSFQDTLGRSLKFSAQSRQPLTLQTHKPIPIPSYIPKFESTSSNYLRRQDPDHERNAATKLRNQYKKEKKGAIRELRKDARFLAGVEQEKQREKDRGYKESMGKVYSSIEGERAEQKAMEREKKREAKRSGRK